MVQSSLRAGLESVLADLTERESNVLRLRFGLEDGRPRTLEEVGKIYHVTRERIRQIEAKALNKLRHPKRIERLKEFSFRQYCALKLVSTYNDEQSHEGL